MEHCRKVASVYVKLFVVEGAEHVVVMLVDLIGDFAVLNIWETVERRTPTQSINCLQLHKQNVSRLLDCTDWG